jgi:HD-GYP domain-containing protein (c-di-GMP phosphodiesterase class II)
MIAAAPQSSTSGELRLSELMSALSHALDLTEGQPAGHCVRSCFIGMAVGRRLGLPEEQLSDLYYALLLKDLGCSSNAARICELYLTDDRAFKADFKLIDGSLPQVLQFVISQTGAKAPLQARLKAVGNILKNGGEMAQQLIETRCTRGADIARRLRFSEDVALAIQGLDEHWDGGGQPYGLRGAAIPIGSRISLLAQVVDVFHSASGSAAAMKEVGRRKGRWFDPAVCDAFLQTASDPAFWSGLADPDLPSRIFALEPALRSATLDDDYLDDIAAAFGQVVDSKSPYTSGHSVRVASYTDVLAEQLGIAAPRRRALRRAALLHDLGKLGVSNAILDKPGKLEADEWAEVQAHAAHTYAILSKIEAFGDMAKIAAAHHERLDGTGYPHGLSGTAISLETRIITACDFYDALTAARPYRGALPPDEALSIMEKSVGVALDPEVFAALQGLVRSQVVAGL